VKEARAFSPCHITGFFQIFDHTNDSLRAGSKGAGVSLCQGVETIARLRNASKTSVQFRINGSASNSTEVSRYVLDTFLSKFKEKDGFEIKVEHSVQAPIGCGFGTSGAAALSLALALNDVFDLGLSKIEAAQVAHVAEVECKTGLGTVIAETFGGAEIRIKPGAPGIGELKDITVPKEFVVACLCFGSISTKKSLASERTRKCVNRYGGELVDKLIEDPEIDNFMTFSRQFAEKTELLTERLRKALCATDEANFVCSMPMFGEAVFTLIEKRRLEELLGIFRQQNSNARIFVSNIDFEGAHVLK